MQVTKTIKKRITRRKGHTIVNAEKEITKEDRARAHYYNYYTGQNWTDIRNYDITIDTRTMKDVKRGFFVRR